MTVRNKAMDDHIATLESKVEAAELQLKRLREELEQARQHKDHFDDLRAKSPAWPLQTAEYRRYARQMILPQVGIAGQLALRSAKVLVVGVGMGQRTRHRGNSLSPMTDSVSRRPRLPSVGVPIRCRHRDTRPRRWRYCRGFQLTSPDLARYR